MKLPEYIEQFLNKIKQKGNGKPMSPKEKWMLLLLSGLLLAVIIFPMGGEEQNPLSGLSEYAENGAGSQSAGIYNTNNAGVYNATGTRSNMQEENFYNGSITDLNQYEIYLSNQLKAILTQIDGAGAVEAWVTLSGSSEAVFFEEKDSDRTSLEEADSVGGTRKEESSQTDKTVVTDSSGNPYIIKTLQPEVEGVLVVAEGADDSTVKKNISEAVEVLFGIDAHRIKVAKKKVEE